MPEQKPRVALIPGASGGIGQAVATRLAADGIKVYAGFNKNQEAAKELVSQIRDAGGGADAVRFDVAATSEVDALCEKIYDESGQLDILVNCAAVNAEAPALGMEDAVWEKVITENLTGAFRLCRAAAKYMLLGRWGRIINISSISAVYGGRGQINYAAAKSGLEGMTRVLALELGRKGVLANCIAPGVIAAGMSERIRQDHEAALLDSIAVRRFGRAEEVAETASFLCSEAASYITGQVIRVDGGMGL